MENLRRATAYQFRDALLNIRFNFLNAAFPYVARRLLTDPDPNLRMRLFKIIIVKGKFEWQRLRELVVMAEAGASGGIKLPMRVAVALVTDTTKMLATDGVARRALVSGLRAVPIREHVSQAASLGVGANARALVPAAA